MKSYRIFFTLFRDMPCFDAINCNTYFIAVVKLPNQTSSIPIASIYVKENLFLSSFRLRILISTKFKCTLALPFMNFNEYGSKIQLNTESGCCEDSISLIN